MPKWIKRLFGVKPKPSLQEEAMQDALNLERDILDRELRMIDHQFAVDALRAKKAHLLRWLQRKPGAEA
jgi:hypothetical protein